MITISPKYNLKNYQSFLSHWKGLGMIFHRMKGFSIHYFYRTNYDTVFIIEIGKYNTKSKHIRYNYKRKQNKRPKQ